MKKKLIIVFCLFAGIFPFSNLKAQQFGAGLVYGSEISNLGLGVNAVFPLGNDKLAISPSFFYYFPKTSFNVKTTWWELNGNVNYTFSETGIAQIFAIGGLNITGVTVKFEGGIFGNTKASDTELGLNIGIGSNFDIGSSILPFVEAKYVLGNADQLSLIFGVRF